MWQGSLHLLSRTNRVCGIADDLVFWLKVTEDLYIAAYAQARDNIHPFRFPIAHSFDESTLLIVRYGGDRYKHGRSSTVNRPLHVAEIAGRKAAIGAMDVQFDRHRPRI